MFVTEALAGDAALMTGEAAGAARAVAAAVPRGFRGVKRQTDILAVEFSALEFLDQLEAEHRIKPEVRESRGMGFVQ
jgi:hypothetical protein